jgi:hypothetical protein
MVGDDGTILSMVEPTVSIEEDIFPPSHIPSKVWLGQNYPNPFNPTTTIKFTLPQSTLVTLTIYNILGEKIATLASEKLSAGNYQYNWDAGSQTGGVYFYRLEINGFAQTKKMLLLR